MKQVKWGIIGPGKIANKFAAALTIAGGAVLEAAASRAPDKARAFAEKFGAARYYDNYERLAEDPGIDAIYIATPHGFHAEHALLCLNKGKAVLCEKPMALNERQVLSMVEASRAHQAFLMEAMWTRFMPLTGKLLEVIGQGRIGKIKYIRADFGFAGTYSPDNRLFNLRLGGGSLLDVGIYPLYLCMQLLGEPAGIQASGYLAPTGADETCHATLWYNEGVSAVIASSFGFYTGQTAEIAGTEGTILIPARWHRTNTFTIQQHPDKTPEVITTDPVENGFEFQIREVARCLEQGLTESPLLPQSFSMAMSRTMDKIRRQIGVKYPGE